jgi:hypothetical protein
MESYLVRARPEQQVTSLESESREAERQSREHWAMGEGVPR